MSSVSYPIDYPVIFTCVCNDHAFQFSLAGSARQGGGGNPPGGGGNPEIPEGSGNVGKLTSTIDANYKM